MTADRAWNSSANEIGRLVNRASTEFNSSRLNTVLPTTSKRLIVKFSGAISGTGSGVAGAGVGGCSNSSGGGSGAGVEGFGTVGSLGGTMSWGGGVGGSWEVGVVAFEAGATSIVCASKDPAVMPLVNTSKLSWNQDWRTQRIGRNLGSMTGIRRQPRNLESRARRSSREDYLALRVERPPSSFHQGRCY